LLTTQLIPNEPGIARRVFPARFDDAQADAGPALRARFDIVLNLR